MWNSVPEQSEYAVKKFEGDSDFFLKIRARSDACEEQAAYASAEAFNNCCKVHGKGTLQLQMKAGWIT